MAKDDPTTMRFQAVLATDSPSSQATYAVLPFDASATFGGRGRIAVCGALNGLAYRGSLFPYGGVYFLGINAALRAAAHVQAGDEVDITMQRDDEPRPVATPDDLAAALQAIPAAQAAWDGLAPSHHKEYVQWIEEAKKPETRQRRVEKTAGELGST